MKYGILASLALCVFIAMMPASALAEMTRVESMEVFPSNPDSWDDITCSAQVTDSNGDLHEVKFAWIRNGVGIRYVTRSVYGYDDSASDTLDSVFTKEGDKITCRVTVRDHWNCEDSDSDYVYVQKTSYNNPPIIQGIPDHEVEIGESPQINLWDFANDVEDSDSELDFSLEKEGNTDVIDCYISGDRWLYCSQAKQLGVNTMTIRVTDTEGAWDTDTFNLRVVGGTIYPDNNPPHVDFIDIDPDTPNEREDITCEVRVEDDDGNLDNVEFRWYVDGRLERTRVRDVSGFVDTAEDTLDSEETNERDDVECRVTVEDSDGEEDHASKTVRVNDGSNDDECRIVIRELEVKDEEDIMFILSNRGDRDAEVEYRIYVDGDRIERDDITVDEDDSEKIRFRYFEFEEGETYKIRVEAEAECGSEDDDDVETVTYTILDGGDNCIPKYLDNTRCSGNWVQRQYRDDDCRITWTNYKHCTDGCYSGSCSGYDPYPPSPGQGCSTGIDSFEFSKNVQPGKSGFVSAIIRNTGQRTQDYRMDVYLDGNYQGNKEFVLPAGASTSKVWNYFVPSAGTHKVRIVVTSDCGASVSREGTLNSAGTTPGMPSQSVCNFNQVCESGEDCYNCPYDCDKPGAAPAPTHVTITPRSMDVSLYKSKVIALDIESFTPQDFRIDVDGVPQDWLSYKQTVNVESKKTVYVFVNPKDPGMYNMVVRVQAVNEGLNFDQAVDMFVARDSQPGTSEDPFSGLVSGLMGNVYLILIIIIIAAAILIFVSYRYLKEDEYVTFEKA